MAIDSQKLAVNALLCLDIGGDQHQGHELHVIYDGDNPFKTEFASAIDVESERRGISTTLHDVDVLRRRHETDDEILRALSKRLVWTVDNPLARNAINMLPPNEVYAGFRGRVTRGLLVPQKAYVLQFPFSEQGTAEVLLAADPREIEGTALAMKKELDRATRIRLSTGKNILEYVVNPALRWVVSVGLVKKYSPLDSEGHVKGGWGNPPGEIFTSFAHSPEDYGGINGFVDFDLFTLGSGLPEGEHFVTPIVGGVVNTDVLYHSNTSSLNPLLMRRLIAEFEKENYANRPGELGIGLMRGINPRQLRDAVLLEKIGNTFHVGFGYDENDRGTGGYITIATHNDCGATGILEAKIDGRWRTIVSSDRSYSERQ